MDRLQIALDHALTTSRHYPATTCSTDSGYATTMVAPPRIKVLVTLDGGGYGNEAKMLIKQLGDDFDYVFVTSEDTSWRTSNLPVPAPLYFMPTMSRKIGLSRAKAAARFMLAVYRSLPVIYRERPTAIIGVASPICLPLFIWGKLFQARCVFIESITRTSKLSLTGRLAITLRLADKLYVQWPELLSSHPQAML